MTAVTAPLAAPRWRSEIDWRKVVVFGAVGGAAVLLVVGIGMFQSFDVRRIVDPYLSASYAAIAWLPILVGFKVSQRPVLEGLEAPPVGIHNVVAGLAAGAITGASIGALLVLSDAVHLRDAFVNISPTLISMLKVGGSTASGAAVFLAAGAILGAVGGSFHLIPKRQRSALGTAVIVLVLLNFLELVVGDILRQADLRNIDRLIYAPSRGLRVVPAVIAVSLAYVLRLTLEGRVVAPISTRYRALSEPARKRSTLLFAGIALALGAYLPSLFGIFLNDVLSTVGLFVLLALGLNIVVGYAGLLDLGYVAFFAVGAYTTAIVTSTRSPAIAPEMAFFEAIPWILLMAVIAGLVIGTPVIRMRGDYLAIVTLGFGEIARFAFNSDWLSGVFGGAQGILRIAPLDPAGALSGIRVSFGYVLVAVSVLAFVIGVLRWREAVRQRNGTVVPLPGTSYGVVDGGILTVLGVIGVAVGLLFPTFATWTITGIDPPAMFRIILVFAALAAYVSWRARDSRVGRAWMAVREDEQVAQTMGINIVTTKLLAFVMGAMLASFGGAFFAVKLGTIFPHSFEIVQSIIILVVVIVGGMGSIRGVVIGAVVLIGILGGPTQSGLLREFGEFKLLIYGVILVWMMLQRPEGLWPEARRAQELHQEEVLQDAWLAQQAEGSGEGGEA
jgi:ABC-type branched-subunit amino acid transport system permease subunit